MVGRDWLVVYLKGAAMGAADAVPGVSGGTIALITGIYERLIDAIAGLDPREVLALLPLLAAVRDPAARESVAGALERMDLPFLVVLGVGVVSAAVTVANVVEFASTEYPGLTYAFFFGLIAASVYVLRDAVRLDTPWRVAAGVAGFVLAFVVSGLAQQALPPGPVVTFVVGAVAICAMVLPGISGSLILVVLGKYEMMTGAVSALTDAALATDLAAAVAPLTVLVVFALGALLGVLTFARVVSWAFEHYHDATLTFLVGLMVGALRAPYRRVVAADLPLTPSNLALLALCALAGAAVVVGLDRATDGVDY